MPFYKTAGVIQRADWLTLPRFYAVANQNRLDVTRRYRNYQLAVRTFTISNVAKCEGCVVNCTEPNMCSGPEREKQLLTTSEQLARWRQNANTSIATGSSLDSVFEFVPTQPRRNRHDTWRHCGSVECNRWRSTQRSGHPHSEVRLHSVIDCSLGVECDRLRCVLFRQHR